MRMGGTPPRSSWGCRTGDHPHAHGEHDDLPLSKSCSNGSSPYAWGAPFLKPKPHVSGRIIPIRMGSTRVTMMAEGRKWDHPHTHGEHMAGLFILLDVLGSSPYVWRALQRLRDHFNLSGIIPMRMGSTQACPHRRTRCRDHPHAHGEHRRRCSRRLRRSGSSPCAWGALRRHGRPAGLRGIIPMRMGSTLIAFIYTLCYKDHPHAHGEH